MDSNIDNIIKDLQRLKEKYGNLNVAAKYRDNFLQLSGMGMIKKNDKLMLLIEMVDL